MAAKKVKVQVEFDPADLDGEVKIYIAELEKQIRSLQNKLSRRDTKIEDLQRGCNLKRIVRQKVVEQAEALVETLTDHDWVEVDRLHF